MRKFLATAILILIASIAYAQDTAPGTTAPQTETLEESIEKLKRGCADFFKTVIDRRIGDAYDKLLKNSPIAERDDELKNLIEQTNRSIQLYGKIGGFEIVNFEAPSPSFVRLRYIALHEDYPTRWSFTFYKSPKRGWIAINVQFDDMSEFIFTDE